MLFFAYDGSINGDWVSHYAARFAAAHPSQRLMLIHIRNPHTNELVLEEKLARIRQECTRLDVKLVPHLLTPSNNEFRAILSVIPKGPESYLVCATRVRERQHRLLTGTISEQLLHAEHCHVLAVRVVQPGLLGLPQSVLLPVAGDPCSARSSLPFLRLLMPRVSRLHILFVVCVSHWRFRWLNHAEIDRRRQSGHTYCHSVEQELSDQLRLSTKLVDTHVRVSDDIPREILIAANRTKSQLICMGASGRKWSKRWMSGNPIERVLRDASCDVAVYRGIE